MVDTLITLFGNVLHVHDVNLSGVLENLVTTTPPPPPPGY